LRGGAARLLGLALLLGGDGPLTAEPPAAVEARLASLAAAAGQREELLRIGLAHAHRVTLTARGPFRILDPQSGREVWKAEFREEIQVVADGGPREGVPSVFRIQVGAFAEREAAERELSRLRELTGAPGIVHHDRDRGNWRVRLGAASDRLALGALMDRLRAAGLHGMWIAEEPAVAASGVTLRLVDASYASHLAGLDRLAVVPAEGEWVSVQGRPYRGLIELRVSPFGTVRPVNWIEIEQYLLGVVPEELGPEVWPELEALRAQAVAARTYAWRNRGQFADEGFDLCDTPRCQVYGGAGSEHPLSDRAVASTRGQILRFEGEPIVALYTATCGGHTEDGQEIFPEHDEPYLRGVPCRAEAEAAATLGTIVRGRAIVAVMDETGADVTRDLALLGAAGVVEPGMASAGVSGEALRRWTDRLAELAGVPAPREAPVAGSLDLAGAVRALVDDLGWRERATVLLAGEDLPALLRDPETALLAVPERRALAYLASLDAIRAFPDGRLRPQELATLARLAPALVRVGESYRAFGLAEGVVGEVRENELRLVRGKGSVRLPLARDVALFGSTAGKAVASERLALWPGDHVQYRTSGAGSIDFLELRPPVKGTSDDRSAKVYAWEVRRTRRELEAAINRSVAVGRLRDLEVVRRGVSGRIVELRVVGSEGSSVVRGFDVRRLLDLRESLLVIEPQRDASGAIEAVVFAGKGWGHGVGLCQVGAYGMALRGASYREILGHYYRGTEIGRLQADR
jgi:stage II sporulation protein D